MEAPQVFRKFVSSVLTFDRAERLSRLVETARGQRKALDALSHEFQDYLRADVATPSREAFWSSPCLLFCSPKTFGERKVSFALAYEELSTQDSWLLVSEDGRFSVYRPEDRWDDERTLAT